jgi:hypothetical protein
MPNTVRLHRVLAMKREKVYRAFIEPDAMVPTWQPGHFQAAPLWQPVGRSGSLCKALHNDPLRTVALARSSHSRTTPHAWQQSIEDAVFLTNQLRELGVNAAFDLERSSSKLRMSRVD